MSIIQRQLTQTIVNRIKSSSKAVIIFGARQVGKTTLVKMIVDQLGMKTLFVTSDEKKFADVFSSRDLNAFQSVLDGYELLVIDEAQRVPDIGINLKLMVDNFKDLRIIATGSSSFALANRVNEPLTGRKWTFSLFPISQMELRQTTSAFDLKQQLNEYLVFGSYPEVCTTKNFAEKRELLAEINRSYLYRDMLDLAVIKNSKKVSDLLKLVAFQIGSEVSINELATSLQISRETVERYLDLLEQSFILFRLKAFSRNLRKEITRKDKIFFYDLGVRNTIINNFNPISDRNDLGALWENFVIVERMKQLSNSSQPASHYFWRTHTGAELDLVEEQGETLCGYEIKFKPQTVKAPQSWLQTYPHSTFESIDRENYLDFVAPK